MNCQLWTTKSIKDQLLKLNPILNHFLQIITSFGHGNLESGVFTSTKQGLYMFVVHAMSERGKTSFLDLYLNDQIVVTVRDFYLDGRSVSGNTAILRLEPGNTVRVKTRPYDEVYVGVGDPPEYYTSFTGVQLDSTNGMV